MIKFQLKFLNGQFKFLIWKNLDFIFFRKTNKLELMCYTKECRSIIPSTSGSLDASDALSLVLQN